MKKILKKLIILMVIAGIIAGVNGGPNRPGSGGDSNSVIETEENVEM